MYFLSLTCWKMCWKKSGWVGKIDQIARMTHANTDIWTVRNNSDLVVGVLVTIMCYICSVLLPESGGLWKQPLTPSVTRFSPCRVQHDVGFRARILRCFLPSTLGV